MIDRAIPLFRSTVSAAAQAAVAEALDSGWLGYGPRCRRLEGMFIGSRGGWALATSSCTSALYLAARLVRKTAAPGPMPEVIVPAITFVATATAFLEAGVRPIVADVSPDTLVVDAAAVRRAITPRTRAIVCVHLYGQRVTELAGLRALADEHGLLLIEDCAHRLDTLDDAPRVGDLLCFSFNAVKEVPCGEGGLLWGRDAAHESRVRAWSNHGLDVDTPQRSATLRHGDYAYTDATGLKLRGNDIAAALALAALPDLARARRERRALHARYDACLAELAPTLQPCSRAIDDSALMYVVKTPRARRDAVRAHMAAAGIATSVHYPSLARHPLFGDARPGAGCADEDEGVMTLPTWSGLGDDDVARVAEALAVGLRGRDVKPAASRRSAMPAPSPGCA